MMKTILSKILFSAMALLFAQGPAAEVPLPVAPVAPPEGGKILTVYYSRSNNTRTIARQIQSAAGGKIVELVPLKAYPEEYPELTELAKKEIGAGFKPALKTKPESIKEYDIIFVGSPCWWATMAPPVATFLTSFDFSGKTIIPFMTHEGSGLGHYVEDLRKLCPKATVLKGKAFRGGSAGQAAPDVATWLRSLKLIK